MALDVVASVGEQLVAPVSQFGYLIFYNRNIKNLKQEVQKLECARDRIQVSVESKNRNGQIIEPGVEKWLTRVDEVSKETERFLRDEDKGWCPNLKSRYSSSKEAKKKIQDVVRLCEGLGDFSSAPIGMASTFISARGFKGFESRRLIMNEVMEALTDDSINMIGLCGMGGVGKTTLVKEIAKKAEEKNLFNEVVSVELPQNPDLTDIQDKIAAQLRFRFSEKKLPDRARELQERILSMRVLVILDDVWKKLELKDIGIPFGADHKSCKIVLTSRSEDVCNDMCPQKKIAVQVLPEDEAWNLFKEHAGISDEDEGSTNHLRSTQKAVARKCGGLPIAIVTVGKAVKSNGTDESSWDFALKLVQKSICKNIKGANVQVFQLLELSYKYLQSEEAKKCFLLCSLFPEDSSIPIEELVTYAIGLKLLQGVTTVGEARDRVHYLVDGLRKWYLLMDSERNECVKMHVVVRDVAISIASSNEQSLMVRLEDWPEKDRHQNYTAISLRSTGTSCLPDNLELPNLQLLQLECVHELPDCFYQGMKELKVVALSYMDVKSLPTSLQCLTNLRTLSLHNFAQGDVDKSVIGALSNLDFALGDVDISVIGALSNLEILSITGFAMKELPKEIGNLTHLRLMYLLKCQVHSISPGVLKRLSRLEELYVGDNVLSWTPLISFSGTKDRESITELASLPSLVALDIHVQFFWPTDLVFRNNFKKFNITIGRGEHKKYSNAFMSQKRLELWNLNASYLIESGLKMLLKSSQILELFDVAGLQSILFDLDEGGFEYLTNLSMAHCRDLEYLIYTSSDEVGVGAPRKAFPVLKSLNLKNLHNFKGIIHFHHRGRAQLVQEKGGPTLTQLDCLRNLRFVLVMKCSKLESVFSLSMAKLLVQLQTIDIYECEMMEAVVSNSIEEVGKQEIEASTDKIKFPNLKELVLRDLPSMTTFCKGVNAIELPQLNNLKLFNMPKLTSLCHRDSMTTIQPLFDIKIAFFSLKKLHLSNCVGFRNLFSLSLATNLVHLRELTIIKCSTMEVVVVEDENENIGEGRKGRTPFPKLKHLELNDLPLLWCFSDIAHEWELPLLESITVVNCPEMIAFSYEFIHIPNIEVVWLQCWPTGEKVEGIWTDDLNATIRKQIRAKKEVEL